MSLLNNRIMAGPYIAVGEASEATSNSGFTIDIREPLPTGRDWSGFTQPAYARVKADATGWLRVDTELSTSTGFYDTVVTIYWRNPETGAFEEIVSDDDGGTAVYGDGYPSAAVFKAGVDATYFVQVLSWSGSSDTNYVVRVQETTAPAPMFDYGNGTATGGQNAFADAGTWLPGTGYTSFNPSSATVEAGEPVDIYQSSLFSAPGGLDTKSLWWKVPANKTGLLQIYCSAGMVSLFTGTTLANLELVQMRSNSGNNSMYMSVYVTEGTTYYLRWSDASSTTISFAVGISKILPVTVVHSRFLNAHVNPQQSGGNGTLVGGTNALADASDATYAEVWAWDTTGTYTVHKAYSFSLNPIVADQGRVAGVHLRMRARLPGPVPDDGTVGPGIGNFYNGLNTILNYTNQMWRWKPTEWKDRVIDATTGAQTYLIPLDMLFAGTDGTTPLGAYWGDGVHEKTISIGWYGTQGNTKYGQVSEAEFIVYLWDDVDVDVKPPDEVGEIDGAQDIDRAAFSTRKY